jgi:hypothetical protein
VKNVLSAWVLFFMVLELWIFEMKWLHMKVFVTEKNYWEGDKMITLYSLCTLK